MKVTRPAAARKVIMRTIEPLVFGLTPGYYYYRARHDWNRRSRADPRANTAAFDAGGWGEYWSSGQRDLDLLLEVAGAAGSIGRGTAVEIGCGLGRLTRLLGARFGRVVGVDISEEMVRQAREHSRLPNIRYHAIGSDFRLPVADATADLVLAWTVFRHVPKHVFAQYLDEARRVLKPGGCLAFEAQVPDRRAPIEPPAYDSLVEREYTRAELEGNCTSHGLAWAADRVAPSSTAGTHTLVMAWRR